MSVSNHERRRPLIVVIFRSRLTPRAGEDYRSLLEEMGRYVQNQPGFIKQKSFMPMTESG